MLDAVLFVGACGALVAVVLLIVLLRRNTTVDLAPLSARLESLERANERAERGLRDEFAKGRTQEGELAKQLRDEVAARGKEANAALIESIGRTSDAQKHQLELFGKRLDELSQSNERRFETLRESVEKKLGDIQSDNTLKLEQMRVTVDEKLQSVLDKRLTDSFKSVRDMLDNLQSGVGEMRALATGVGDLKRVLANVKTRGNWGEVQLGALLEQMLAPEQFERNVVTRPGSTERVEFAIKLPGRGERSDRPVWLPIDAKFPQEDYQRLIEASERGDAEAVDFAVKQLDQRIRGFAKDIAKKYVEPPHTTDFALMFLPTEGLYAEIVRRTELVETLQREQRIVIAGPTTLAALLNSLQMGFRTLAIEQRSSEIAKVLGEVKTEFGRFGDVIAKVKEKLDQASKQLDTDLSVRTRAIDKKLRVVEALPVANTPPLLIEPEDDEVATS
ncbi:MAG: DNA recombination protein RmuC [Planctomycetes bacterium]|nr:DNA recombination protein RmuC [Planctomycetota bacterium]